MKRSMMFIAIAAIAMAGNSVSLAQTTPTVAVVPPQTGLSNLSYQSEHFSIGIEGRSLGNAVEVRQVFSGSSAHRLGLEAGDWILKVNNRMTPNLDALRHALADAGWNQGGRISLLIDNVRARRGEYGAQRYVIRSGAVDVSQNTISRPQSHGPLVVTPNQIDAYNPDTGQLFSSNLQIDHSATDPYRDLSRQNGTLRSVKRPIYDLNGNLVGFQEGQVWNNSVTGQEHGVLNNTTIDQHGNVHQQRQITRQITGQ